jgi:hypothetical protein
MPAAAAVREDQKVRQVLEEIVRTERSYIASLGKLEKCLPILAPHLDAANGQEMLTAAAALHGVHDALLERLDVAGETDLWVIARAFSQMADFLKLYSTYCAGFTRAQQRLITLRQNPNVAAELFAFESDSGGGGGERIDSLLIKPVQRLLKYPLFFAELLRALPTADGGADGDTAGAAGTRAELEAAERAVRRVSEEVNEKTRNEVNGVRIAQLHEELGGKLPALLAPTRSLLLEVDIKLAPRRGPTASRKRYLLALLTDAVVLARRRRKRFSFSRKRAAAEAGAGGAAAALALKAVLPLAAVTLELAPARKSRAAAAAGKSPLLALQCASPVLKYLCKCEGDKGGGGGGGSAALIEAVQKARLKLEDTRRHSSRRASLAPSSDGDAAMGAEGGSVETASLLACARSSRRSSMSERFRRNRSSSSRRSSAGSVSDVVGAGASSAMLAGAGAESDDDDTIAGDGLVGVVCPSDEGESSSESSGAASASEWDD